jgi:hypothetical protein
MAIMKAPPAPCIGPRKRMVVLFYLHIEYLRDGLPSILAEFMNKRIDADGPWWYNIIRIRIVLLLPSRLPISTYCSLRGKLERGDITIRVRADERGEQPDGRRSKYEYHAIDMQLYQYGRIVLRLYR